MPTDLLFEAPQLTVELARDQNAFVTLAQHDIDHPTCWARDEDLGRSNPASMEVAQETFLHRSLTAVVDPRPGGREQSQRDVGTEHHRDRRYDTEPGIMPPDFDPGEVGRIDPGRSRDRRLAQSGVLAQAAHGLADRAAQLDRAAASIPLDRRLAHPRSEPTGPYVRLTSERGVDSTPEPPSRTSR